MASPQARRMAGDIGDAAAAGGDRHAVVARQAIEQRLQLGSDPRRDVVDGELRGSCGL